MCFYTILGGTELQHSVTYPNQDSASSLAISTKFLIFFFFFVINSTFPSLNWKQSCIRNEVPCLMYCVLVLHPWIVQQRHSPSGTAVIFTTSAWLHWRWAESEQSWVWSSEYHVNQLFPQQNHLSGQHRRSRQRGPSMYSACKLLSAPAPVSCEEATGLCNPNRFCFQIDSNEKGGSD